MKGEQVEHRIRRIGSTFHYQKRKYHIVGYMVDEEINMPVYVVRYYGKYKQWWHFEAITADIFDMNVECGWIKE